jgi:hypothetical protein
MDRGAIFLGIVSTGFASSRPDVGVRTRPGDPEGPCLGRWSGVSSGCCPVSEVAACRAGYGWRGNTSMVASEPYACPVHRARRGHRDNARHRSHTRVPLTAPGAVKGTKPSRSRACDRFTAPPAGLAMRRSGVNVAGGRARGRVCRSAATPASVSVHRRPAPRTRATHPGTKSARHRCQLGGRTGARSQTGGGFRWVRWGRRGSACGTRGLHGES